MREPNEQDFLKEVSQHEMTICLNTGLHRHVRFSRPNTSNLWFSLVTWPGYLTIAGDMGTWTFARVPDMFEFFRSSAPGLHINCDYWAEKLQHGTGGGSRDLAKRFDIESWGKSVLDQLANYYSFKGAKLKEITAAVKEEVLSGLGHCDQQEAYQRFRDFRFERGSREDFCFDWSETPSGMVYSYQFIWCLYAIVWGIRQYDARAVAVPA